jgi:transcriptional regulator with XRE-family HTH domain
MTRPDAMHLLRGKADELGQAETARRLQISPSAVNQLLHGKYGAAPDGILQRVVEVFGRLSVPCPILGEIPLAQCKDERGRPFAASNHLRVRLYRACRGCTAYKGDHYDSAA